MSVASAVAAALSTELVIEAEKAQRDVGAARQLLIGSVSVAESYI